MVLRSGDWHRLRARLEHHAIGVKDLIKEMYTPVLNEFDVTVRGTGKAFGAARLIRKSDSKELYLQYKRLPNDTVLNIHEGTSSNGRLVVTVNGRTKPSLVMSILRQI